MTPLPTNLRIGLIGAGGIAHAHAGVWLLLGHEVIVHSDFGAEEFAAKYSIAVEPDLAELLTKVDAVDICTPTFTHEQIAMQALDAGVQVICEKPLSLEPASAHRIAARASELNLGLYPAHVVRFTGPFERARQAVSTGAIGAPAVARFRREGGRPERVDWFADFAKSGGVIMDLMIHDLDQAAWLFGPVETVYAMQSPALTREGEHFVSAAEVTAHVTLKHSNQAITLCRASWGPPGMAFNTSFSISGDQGTIEYDSRHQNTTWESLVTSDGKPAPGLTIDNPLSSPFYGELKEFADDIVARLHAANDVPADTAGATKVLTASKARISGAEGAYSVSLASAALHSLQSGTVEKMVDHLPLQDNAVNVEGTPA